MFGNALDNEIVLSCPDGPTNKEDYLKGERLVNGHLKTFIEAKNMCIICSRYRGLLGRTNIIPTVDSKRTSEEEVIYLLKMSTITHRT
jgi:hypothetical protein